MKLKLFSQLTLVFLLSVCTAHTVNALTTLGGNPFYQPPLTSVSDLKNMVVENQGDVKTGLVKAGYGDLADAFFAQLPDAEVNRVEYPPGQTFQWMFYKKGGKGAVRVDQGVLWEGNTPIVGYEFFIDQGGQRYTFAVPLICANFALLSVAPVPPPESEPVIPPVTPPADSAQDTGAGSPGTGSGPQVTAKTAAASPFLFDVGYLHQLDPAHHAILRGGMEYNFSDNFSIIGMVGIAPLFRGAESAHAFTADVTGNYSWSRMFVGFGLGAWITNGDSDIKHEDSDLDLIFNIGARVYGEPEGFNTSLYFEVRSGVDELDEFDKYGRLGAGLRFRF